MSDGLPKDSILVDLAVVGREKDRVISHFVPVTLPLSDVSLVSLVFDSQVRERQISTSTLLCSYEIHAAIYQARGRGELARFGYSVVQYCNRFNDMVVDERKAFMQD